MNRAQRSDSVYHDAPLHPPAGEGEAHYPISVAIVWRRKAYASASL